MNILNTLTRRSLKLNRKRTIVTIIGIILSTAMICATITIAASFQDLFVQRAMQTDGNFHATFYDIGPGQMKYITGNAYTEISMLSRNLGFARFDQSTNENRPYFFIKEYDAVALRHMPIKLTSGRYPEKAGELLISEEIAKSGGKDYRIGETIAFDLGERLAPEGEELPEATPYDESEQFAVTATRAFTITGIIARPHFENFTSNPGFTVVAYLDPEMPGAGDLVNISILGKNPRQIYERIPEMAKEAGEAEYAYNNELLKFMGISKNERATAMINTVALIIILLIIVGSVTVIYNAFAISVSERKKQFGLLASTGATPGQIRRSVLFEGALLGLMGIPPGILSGIGGIGVTLSVVNRLAAELLFGGDLPLRLVITPLLVPATVAFVVLIILISAYLPANRAAAISPIEAIRQSADIKIRGNNVKTSRLTRLLFGIEGELALKNLKRNRRRYRTTVFSLCISIVLFVSFSTFVNYAITGGGLYQQEVNFDFNVIVESLNPGEQRSIYEQIAALDGVERCAMHRTIVTETWLTRGLFGTYSQKNFLDQDRLPMDESGRYRCYFHLTALSEREFELFVREQGLAPETFRDADNPRGILINKNRSYENTIAEYEPLQAKAGDRFDLAGVMYHDDSEIISPALTMEIGAVTDSFPLGVQPADTEWVNLIISEELYEAARPLMREQGEEPGDDRGTLQLYLITGENTDLAGPIREICKEQAEGGIHIQDIKAMLQEMKRTKAVINIFLYGFITLITLIGVTNIFNTISTNVALRRREFAMLKSMGLTPRGFNKMFNYESIFYGLNALLYGLPVSALISLWMYNGFGNMFGFTFFLPWKEIGICVAGVFIIVFATMIHAGSRLKHNNIIDALKEENL